MDLRSLWRRFGGEGRATDPGSSDGSDALNASGASEAGGVGGGPVAEVARPTRPAWRDLDPIAPTVKAAPLVAPTVLFSHGLSGHQAPPLALETLGHDRPADAPAGVVSGLFVGRTPHAPVQDEGGGTARVSVRGRAPRPTDGAATSPEPARLAGTSASAGSSGSAMSGSGWRSPLAASGLAPAAARIAPVVRPVVARSAADAGAGGHPAMTSAPQVANPTPPGMIGRPAVAGATATAPRPAPLSPAASAIPVSPTIAMSATPVEPTASVLGANARRNLGQRRRLRIGPAIGPGALDLGDHDAQDGGAAGRSDGATRPGRTDATANLSVAGGPGSSATTADPEPGSQGSGPAVARSLAPSDAAATPAPGPAGTPAIQRSADTSATVGATVPARPIASRRQVERAPLVGRLEVGRGSRPASAAESSGARSATPSAGHARPNAPAPRSVVQEALAALSGASAGLAASGGRAGGGLAGATEPGALPATIQRTADSSWAAGLTGSSWSATEGWTGPASPGGATEPTAASVVARTLAAGSSTSGSGSGAGGGAWSPPIRQLRATRSAAQGGARAGASSAPVGVVVARSVASPTLSAAAEPPADTVWRTAGPAGNNATDATEDTAPAGILVPVQRLEAGEAPIASAGGTAGASATPTVLRAADGGDGGGAAGGGSDKELEELARKLFPRLQQRLRGELLIDRERIGALVDLGR